MYDEYRLSLIYAISNIPEYRKFIEYLKFHKIIKFNKEKKMYDILDEQLKDFFTEKELTMINFDPIVHEMIELYPKGIKPNTNTVWRGNKLEIRKKLEKLYKLTDGDLDVDLIVPATKLYVDSFNNDNTFMRTLPYFILKRQIVDGEYEYKSDKDEAVMEPIVFDNPKTKVGRDVKKRKNGY